MNKSQSLLLRIKSPKPRIIKVSGCLPADYQFFIHRDVMPAVIEKIPIRTSV